MGFLELPGRSEKPREQGITHVLDRGLSLAEVDGLVEVAGGYVDLVKLGWGTALATQNLSAWSPGSRNSGCRTSKSPTARSRSSPTTRSI